MKNQSKLFAIVAALAVLIGIPLFIYAIGDFPRRSLLKEAISVLTIVSLALLIGQFFFARSFASLSEALGALQMQKIHKYIGYAAVSALLLHPFLIVLPRYFEGGVKPLDAFVTMLTTFDSLGILLGLGAWCLMLVMGLMAYHRMAIIRRFQLKYRNWRFIHGGVAMLFVVGALWHAILLGRHVNLALSGFFILCAAVGIGLLVWLYRKDLFKKTNKRGPSRKAHDQTAAIATQSLSEGAKS